MNQNIFLLKKIGIFLKNSGLENVFGFYSELSIKKSYKNIVSKENLQRLKILIGPFFLMLFYLLSVFLPFIVFQNDIYASNEGWLKSDNTSTEKVWVDTSHWESSMVYKKDGYYKDIERQRWVDTSYIVKQGNYKTGDYKVWVDEKSMQSYIAKRYIDTSHWETRYRYVNKTIPVNFSVINGTDSYGWSVYSFAAQARGMHQVLYGGQKYMAAVYVIDYRPARGGRVYATKYIFLYKYITIQEAYNVRVSSGYWEDYTVKYLADTSHWETRTGKYWVNTSYTVKSGYWEGYYEKEWVDTSHYQSQNFWVKDGYYEEPMHGKITITKDPKYIFTKWHSDNTGNECGMSLKVDWEIDKSKLLPGQVPKKIVGAYFFEDVIRYKNKGIDKVIIFKNSVVPAICGSINTFTLFNFAGNEDSVLHVFLNTESGQIIHVYFSNPINGFKAINIDSNGTSSAPDRWLGGNSYGEIEF